MAHAGDCYTVELRRTHFGWGRYRSTATRNPVAGEGYIPIPREYAQRFELLNSNGTGGADVPGKNIFRYRTEDGFAHGTLKAQGCESAGNEYAKQFSEEGNLKAIGSWFAHIGVEEGTQIKVLWETDEDVVLSKV